MLDFNALTVAQLQAFTRLNLPADVVEAHAEVRGGKLLLQVLTETCDFDVEIDESGATTRSMYPVDDVGGTPVHNTRTLAELLP